VGDLPITLRQRRALEAQLDHAADARLFRRTLAVLEFGRGRPVAEIADELRVTRQSVYNWVAGYLGAGTPEALADKPRAGRPGSLGEEGVAFLRDVLDHSPRHLGYPHAGWTVPLLRDVLEAGTGARFAETTVRRALAQLDYAWKRPRHALAPDPEREKKTPHPPGDPGPARAHRRPGRGRNRPVALSAPPGRLVEARGGR
jgi:transposase